MNDKLDETVISTSKKELDGLIRKGLIKMIGHDPLGRPLYMNTPLGDEVADYLDAMEDTDALE